MGNLPSEEETRTPTGIESTDYDEPLINSYFEIVRTFDTTLTSGNQRYE